MKDEITRELKDMVEEENAQLKTFSIFHRASKLPVDPFKWGEKGGGIKLGIDMSLDLEKFSERNYSYFYLLILRNEISFQNLLLFSIFKILEILRKYFSVSSVRRSLCLPPLTIRHFISHRVTQDINTKTKMMTMTMTMTNTFREHLNF